MTAGVITAVILIFLVLLAMCAALIWRVRELEADLDLVTRELIRVLNPPADAQPGLIRILNPPADARKLPPGYPG